MTSASPSSVGARQRQIDTTEGERERERRRQANRDSILTTRMDSQFDSRFDAPGSKAGAPDDPWRLVDSPAPCTRKWT